MSTNDPTSTSVFTSATVRASLPLALRFAVYTLLVAALSVMLPDIVRHHGVEFFYENGSLEWFQFGLLTTNILLFTLSALCLPKHRQLALLLGCVTAFAATREVDRVLNRLLPVVGWKIGGGVSGGGRLVVSASPSHAATADRGIPAHASLRGTLGRFYGRRAARATGRPWSFFPAFHG